jgi:hypothetical protein
MGLIPNLLRIYARNQRWKNQRAAQLRREQENLQKRQQAGFLRNEQQRGQELEEQGRQINQQQNFLQPMTQLDKIFGN